MSIEQIVTKKKFDELMRDVNIGVVGFVQMKSGVRFECFGMMRDFYVDFVNYYNWFDEGKHGKDRVVWGKEKLKKN